MKTLNITLAKCSILCLLVTLFVLKPETNASPVLAAYQHAPRATNTGEYSFFKLPPHSLSSSKESGTLRPSSLPEKSSGFENNTKPRVKRGLKSSLTGLFNGGNKQPITQRPRSNSLPAVLPSTASVGLFNNGNKQLYTFRPRSNSLPSALPSIPPLGAFNNQNKLPNLTPPRSNSPVLPSTPAGFGSTWNNPFSRKPMFGTDSSSSSSHPRTISPNLSPATSAGSSRRGSFGLQDQMELLSIEPKTASQLQQIDTWEKRPINSAGLNDNCYYCTAAGLTGRNTDTMVKRTQTMQNRFGSVDDTKDLLKSSYHPNVQSRLFPDSSSMKQYLNDRLLPGTSQGFGVAYYHSTPRPPMTFHSNNNNNNNNNGPDGHMVGMKAWKTPEGSIGTRVVDFQLPPEQRFTSQPNNNWSPPGSFHLIDLHPPKPMDEWNTLKRPPTENLQGETPKRFRFTGR